MEVEHFKPVFFLSFNSVYYFIYDFYQLHHMITNTYNFGYIMFRGYLSKHVRRMEGWMEERKEARKNRRRQRLKIQRIYFKKQMIRKMYTQVQKNEAGPVTSNTNINSKWM